jgi:hypothetical protein
MEIDKIVAARISAFWNSWSPDEFAKCANNGTVYQPAKGACFFSIGRGDREFPQDELTDMK